MDNYYGNICYCRKCNGIVHTIKPGDTLYLLSKYYKVPIGEIMAANRNLNVYNLQVGDEICIPVKRPEPVEVNGSNGTNNMPNNMQGNMPNNMRSNMESGMGNTAQSNMTTSSVDNELIEKYEVSDDLASKECNVVVSEISGEEKLKDIMDIENLTLSELANMINQLKK